MEALRLQLKRLGKQTLDIGHWTLDSPWGLGLWTALVALVCLAFAIWVAAHAGLSRLYAATAANTRSIDDANTAIDLSPHDADAHLLRALLLNSQNQYDKALIDLEQATALRPRDYVLWMELGLARDETGNTTGAIEAFKAAVANAPAYAGPHWQLGNVLLRSGRIDEAFREMRLAAQSNPAYLPQLIDLAWNFYRGEVAAVERAISPTIDKARMALARFAAAHGKPSEAATIFRTIETVSEEDRTAFVKDLLAAKEFQVAFEIWAAAHPTTRPVAGLIDGGFEGQIGFDDTAFGWRVARNVPNVRASIDQAAPHGGLASLRLDWNGDSSPAANIISQTVMVEPRTHYRLSFAVRTEELVTGGPPLIVVLDAGSKDGLELGRSAPFTSKTAPWQDSVVEFTSGDATAAVLVVLRRQNCATGPCPIFGRVWLDDFKTVQSPMSKVQGLGACRVESVAALCYRILNICLRTRNSKLETADFGLWTLDIGHSLFGRYLLNNPQSCHILRPQIQADIAVAPGIIRT